MKFSNKPLLAVYVVAVMLFTDFKMFAQPDGPGDDSEGGGSPEDEDPALPISGKLAWLLVAGVLFAAYKIAASRKQAHS